jgi:hypothetical protein
LLAFLGHMLGYSQVWLGMVGFGILAVVIGKGAGS